MARTAVARAVERVAEGIPRALGGLLNHAVLLVLIMVIAWGLLAARFTLIEMSPILARHAGLLAGVVNYYLDTIDLFIYALRGAIDLIRDAINFFRGRGHAVVPARPKLNPVNVDELRQALMDLPARCVNFEGVGPVMVGLAKSTISNYTCPLIRETWPVPWLWTITSALLGWTSTNAVPPNAYYEGDPGNCEPPEDTDWLCIALGAGYIAAEVLLPLLLIVILWSSILMPVVDLAVDIFVTAAENVGEVIRTGHFRLDAAMGGGGRQTQP